MRGTVVVTSDGGANWTVIESAALPDVLFAVDFADADHGCVVADRAILTTSDGGRTWTPRMTGSPCVLWDVEFADVQHGWVVGLLGTILATSDGGLTWKPQSPPVGSAYYGVSFADPAHGWISGSWGDITATTNGGVSPKPVIKKITPATVKRNRVITISGSGFGAYPYSLFTTIHVWVGTTRVKDIFPNWNDHLLKVTVAPTTKLGKQKVVVKSYGGASNTKTITVKK